MKPEEMAIWHWTRAGRRFRQRVVDPLSHEEYRRMIRETYPAAVESLARTALPEPAARLAAESTEEA